MNLNDSSQNKTGLPEEAEWLKTAPTLKSFPIGKTSLYALADFNGGPLLTSEIRQRGKTRGIRLWNVQSIRDLIEAGRTTKAATETATTN